MRTRTRSAERFLVLWIAAVLGAGFAHAKSLYLIADINDNPTPIHAYDIQPTPAYTAFQKERDVPAFGGGAVGLAIDGVSRTLFITYESSNVIQLIDATNFADLGAAAAPDAANLAGLVVDHSKQRVYAVERGTALLHIYEWAADARTLTSAGPPTVLPGVERAFGLALDEGRGLLYIGDIGPSPAAGAGATPAPVVRFFNTSNWMLAGAVELEAGSQPPMSIAVDPIGNALYMGNATAALGSRGMLLKYDLTAGAQASYLLPQNVEGLIQNNVVGVAVDADTGYVYVTTGDEWGSGADLLMVFDAELNVLKSEPVVTRLGNVGNPTGVAVAPFDVSFNPLNFSKKTTVEQAVSGGELTYMLCYDNLSNAAAFDAVTLTDRLPADVEFLSASDPGAEREGVVTWDLGEVAAGAQSACQTLVVQVQAPPGALIANSATIEGTIGEDVLAATQTVSTPIRLLDALQLTVDDGRESVESGAALSYAVCYANLANTAGIADVAIEGALPAGARFVSITGPGAFDGERIRWNIGAVAGGAPEVCHALELQVTAPGGGVVTAAFELTGLGAEPTTAADATAVLSPLRPLNIGVDDAVDSVRTGGQLTFQVCYDNAANDREVRNVVISGAIPSGGEFVSASAGGVLSGGDVVWTEGLVQADAAQICHELQIRVTAAAGGQVSASFQIVGDGAPVAAAGHSTQVVATPPPPEPPQQPAGVDSKGGGGAFGLDLALIMAALACLRRRIGTLLLASLVTALLAPLWSAQAQDTTGWYVGTKVGLVDVDAGAAEFTQALASLGHDVQASMDASDSGWAVFTGYRFSPYLALEASYLDLGEVTSHLDLSVQNAGELDSLLADLPRVQPYSIDGYSLSAMAGLPIGRLMVYARAGWMWRQNNAEASTGAAGFAARDHGVEPLYGAGLQHQFAKRWTARVEWERYTPPRNEIDYTSFSLTYRF